MAWGNSFDLPIPAKVGNTILIVNKSDKPLVINPPITAIIKEHSNKVPTHDPYSNPDAHIYYQCNCGAVLDPGTKSFAALNNCAMNSGWKIRWGHEHYMAYCVECGKDIE